MPKENCLIVLAAGRQLDLYGAKPLASQKKAVLIGGAIASR